MRGDTYSAAAGLAAAYGWEGTVFALPTAEGLVFVAATVDAREHERRVRKGLGSITNLRSLALLGTLPHGHGVAFEDGHPALDLARIGPGVVDVRGTTVERTVQVPARIHGAIAARSNWRRSATALGQFTTIAPRAALIDRPADDQVLAEASIWGIGVAVATAMDLDVVAEPAPASVEHGPYQWSIAEAVYAAATGAVASIA